MLKKIALLNTLLLFVITNTIAQLPYSKMLNLTNDELKEKKFKYDKNKNLYSMSKLNATNKTLNVLSAIGGNAADIKPHKDDYIITLQKGKNNQTSYLSVVFYDDEMYHKIATWIEENNIDVVSTDSRKKAKTKFMYDKYRVELVTDLISVEETTTTNTSATAKRFDDSFYIYTYTIYTGVKPDSKWHTKEAAKKAKKRLKGDKEDLEDLM